MLLKQNKILSAIISYINKSLGFSINPKPWNKSDKLPLILNERYSFYTVKLSGIFCMFFIEETEKSTPAIIAKHCRLLTEYWKGGIIFSRSCLSARDRSRLIKAKIPFIIPYKQLYLPFIGIDLKELFPLEREKGTYLSPLAQVLVLGKLYKKEWINETPSKIAEAIGMSKMSVGRAFNELYQLDIGNIKQTGKEKHFVFHKSGQTLWERIVDQLRSPVTSMDIVFSKPNTEMILSGESALACYSMIQEPDQKTMALWNRASYNSWILNSKQSKYTGIDIIIQKWSYNPSLFSKRKIADPLSIYLEFKETNDERIEMALDELIKEIRW